MRDFLIKDKGLYNLGKGWRHHLKKLAAPPGA
jgi:hypothetical protein